MPLPWAITPLTRQRPGILAWRRTYLSTTRALPRRYYNVSPEASSDPKSRILADPERPDLFYHLFEAPSAVSATNHVFGLSFLRASRPGEDARSPRIIGYLPATEAGHAIEAGLNDFRENPAFRKILHKAVLEGLEEGVDEVQANGARQLQEGWMHIHDERNIPPLGRIGDPDDIIASVRVQDGKFLTDTYQPMPAYRMCTSDGVLKLTEGLAQKLKQVLERDT
ncbi:hypothetical protein BJ322DRAFT_1145098 [Thelephora terrestris]|uniref:Uncharacterized protein n=1 Tax=Thelephora terrestris TaxID=56493 RepID=A0A9P6H7W1_9AGAM|nr:hypothetical protein BJ322DRAFT_1145098 [Thelephora terrestris]